MIADKLKILSILIYFLSIFHGSFAPSSKNNLIFTAFTVDPEKTRYTYKFDGVFTEDRVDQLITIYEQDGSVQSNDVLEYGEFEQLNEVAINTIHAILLKNLKEKIENEKKNKPGIEEQNEEEIEQKIKIEEKIWKFKKAVPIFKLAKTRLDKKIQKFIKKHEKTLKHSELLEEELRKEAAQHESDEKPSHRFVLACKLFMFKLMSEGAEGTWLDLFSFMKNEKYNYSDHLSKINQISTIQSPRLDHLGIVAILNGHLANRRRQREAYARGGKARGLAEGDIALEIEEELGNLGKENGIGEKVDESESDGIAADQNQRERPPLNRVLIEGAGPIGLYAAFQSFLAGASVTIVNDRSEPYLRNRMVFFDAKYMVQFRLLLGTLSDQLFIGPKAFGQINEEVVGQLNIKNMEEALKYRLISLAKYVQEQTKDPARLKIEYDTSLNTILYPTAENPEYRAKLVQSTKQDNKSRAKFNQYKLDLIMERVKALHLEQMNKSGASRMQFEKFLAELREKEYEKLITAREEEIRADLAKQPGGQHSTMVQHKHPSEEGIFVHSSPRRQAIREFEGKAAVWKPELEVPFDVLICAGGAKDEIRTKFISDVVQDTIPKSYGTVVFNKSTFSRTKTTFTMFSQKTVFYGQPMGRRNEFDVGIDEIMEKLQFQKHIQNSNIPPELKAKYANINNLVKMGLKVKKKFGRPEYNGIKGYDLFETDDKGHFVPGDGIEPFIIRLFENKPTLHIASITPVAIEEFFRDIEDNKETMDINDYKKFRVKMERLWELAVFEYSKLREDKKLVDRNIEESAFGENAKFLEFDDQGSLNSAIWSLIIWSVKNAVREFGANDDPNVNHENLEHIPNARPAIGLAVGDANTSAHFMTASGMSTGRLAVEKAIQNLRDYNQWKIDDKGKLLKKLSENLNAIKHRVLKKALLYVDPISDMYAGGQKQAVENSELVASAG